MNDMLSAVTGLRKFGGGGCRLGGKSFSTRHVMGPQAAGLIWEVPSSKIYIPDAKDACGTERYCERMVTTRNSYVFDAILNFICS